MNKLAISPIYKIGRVKEISETKNNLIEGYSWCDKNQNTFTNGVMKYGQSEIFALCIFHKSAIGKTAVIEIINRTKGNTIETKRFIIVSNRMLIKINEENVFKSCDSKNICYFSMRISVGKQKYYPDPQWVHQNLKIHFVILIPKIMNKLGWRLAEKAQNEWFEGKGVNYPWEAKPKIDYYTFGGLLNFERFKKFYEKHKDDWKDTSAISQLKKEIVKMEKEGLVQYPTVNNPITEFDSFSWKITQKNIHLEELKGKEATELMPIFEKFYFKSVAYNESVFNPLDDFFGAIANCNLRFAAKGFLHYNNGKIKVEIEKIATYVKDGFDFVGEQPLGS